MHSYWDDAFVLRGLKDAVVIAHALGKRADERRFAAMRDEFRRDLMASYRLAMQQHHIDFLPGSVELGDFDATSTTVAVAPGGELANLPEPGLRNTFDRYWEQSKARTDGTKAWENYTPYELRTIGTFVRLGDRWRAHAMLDFFFGDQRPAPWNQWAEVVWRDPSTPKFIGDMPHTWVGSDFIRSVSDMFAYEREADSSLVVAAGVRPTWVTEAPGIAVRGLRTYYGPLSYTMRGDGSAVRVHLERLARTPAGGVVLRSPLDKPIRGASVNGAPVKLSGPDELRLPRDATDVVLRY
jgi:hypothetical protein